MLRVRGDVLTRNISRRKIVDAFECTTRTFETKIQKMITHAGVVCNNHVCKCATSPFFFYEQDNEREGEVRASEMSRMRCRVVDCRRRSSGPNRVYEDKIHCCVGGIFEAIGVQYQRSTVR